MRRDGFLRFHRGAEAAGYPALLIIAMVSLTMVVAAVAVLGLTGGAWAFLFAVMTLGAALALLWGEIDAALSDVEEPAAGERAYGSAPSKPQTVVSMKRPDHPTGPEHRSDRQAA